MEGLVGQVPKPGQLAGVLCRKDAFVYCGHGSGSTYISSDDIEKLRVRAVPLLLGCSSGQLVRMGRQLDPLGTAQSYLMASAAAMLGFLWPVSDKVRRTVYVIYAGAAVHVRYRYKIPV
jgi:separase